MHTLSRFALVAHLRKPVARNSMEANAGAAEPGLQPDQPAAQPAAQAAYQDPVPLLVQAGDMIRANFENMQQLHPANEVQAIHGMLQAGIQNVNNQIAALQREDQRSEQRAQRRSVRLFVRSLFFFLTT